MAFQSPAIYLVQACRKILIYKFQARTGRNVWCALLVLLFKALVIVLSQVILTEGEPIKRLALHSAYSPGPF